MNRIALKVKEARLKAKMTEKQLAKKCGLTESYIVQVESGKKVVNEKTAERILGVLGEKLDSITDMAVKEEHNGQKLEKRKLETRPKETLYDIQPTDQWKDALANIIKTVPIYELASSKVVGSKEMPIINKKIEGYHWEKIICIQTSDDSLKALRLHKGDTVIICLTNEIQNNHVYLIEYGQVRMLRQLRKIANNKVILLKGTQGEEGVTADLSKVKIVGKCIKAEFTL